ncbi:MAG: 30S ribosomal protein S1 [Rickettsiales bacterium]|nr:30S ribosomal protein S1 [Rickettsiales bacterium]OUT44242.1 MAG: 30S ribosomal protein S1 [Pelagibacteraceae bacterium TMED13]|tara:strand:+ start:40 stop:1710 length:1671 start_codon:yes stop_codon:yes gene_type:complete
MLESSLSDFRYKEGEIIKGTVLSIVNDTVVVDVGLKSEGRIPLKEFHSPGEDHNVKIGDEFDVYLEKLENKEGEALLSRERARKEESWSQLEKMQDKKQEIMGVITGRVKGGFAVDINGAVAFLPGSQVDLKPVKDISPLLNKSQPMVILKMDKLRGNIVVSRRALLEESRKADRSKLLSDISEGDKLKGNVKNITDYGVFVDLGGLDGLVHVTDLSWERVNHPSEMFQIGQEIEVMVTKYDTENNRISLGIKQLTDDPWHNVEEQYKVGNKIKSKITSIADYGAFMELSKGVEGLIHTSEMSWVNKNVNPNSILEVGQEVEVLILEVDNSKRRISLGLKQCTENPWEDFAKGKKSGDIVEGKIKNITDFGLFVELTKELDGLIHLSDLSWEDNGENEIKKYNVGDNVKFKILEIDVNKERVSLGIKQLSANKGNSDKFINKIVTSIIEKIEIEKMLVKFDENEKGFIKKSNLAKVKTEQNTSRFAEGEKIDAKVLRKNKKEGIYELSIKDLEIEEEKEALKEYGSSSSGASIGDIIGAALEEGKTKSTKDKDEKK